MCRPSFHRPPLILVLALMTAFVGACAKQEASPSPVTQRGAVEASASVDKAVATTGDVITYRMVINHREDVALSVPEVGSEIAGLRIIDFGHELRPPVDGRIETAAWYQLRGDLVGSYVLPSIQIPYQEGTGDSLKKGTIETSEIFLEIKSVLPKDGTAQEIRGLKRLRRVEPQVPWHIYLGILAILLGAAAFLIWRHFRKREVVEIPPAPAHVLAFEALNHLRQTDFENPSAVRKYYFSLSQVLRAYVENRFSVNATDLTTEELLPIIQQNLPIESSLKNQLRSFLQSTDAVKFGGQPAEEADIERNYEQALTFVEATVPVALEQEEAA